MVNVPKVSFQLMQINVFVILSLWMCFEPESKLLRNGTFNSAHFLWHCCLEQSLSCSSTRGFDYFSIFGILQQWNFAH